MQTFFSWLAEIARQQRLLPLLRLIEANDYYDASAYNQVFQSELEALRQRIPDLTIIAKLDNLKDMDWAGYIAKELRKAGFRGNDVEEHLHQIVVKLLIAPGKLFNGWNPQQHGPLEKRFGSSVRNEIINIVTKESNRRKYVPTVPIYARYGDGGVADQHLAAPQTNDDHAIIENFRQWLRKRLGSLALTIFDARLNGEDISLLVGLKSLGSPTSYKIKTTVQQMKRSAWEFAAGDPILQQRIEKLLDADQQSASRFRRSEAFSS